MVDNRIIEFSDGNSQQNLNSQQQRFCFLTGTGNSKDGIVDSSNVANSTNFNSTGTNDETDQQNFKFKNSKNANDSGNCNNLKENNNDNNMDDSEKNNITFASSSDCNNHEDSTNDRIHNKSDDFNSDRNNLEFYELHDNYNDQQQHTGVRLNALFKKGKNYNEIFYITSTEAQMRANFFPRDNLTVCSNEDIEFMKSSLSQMINKTFKQQVKNEKSRKRTAKHL